MSTPPQYKLKEQGARYMGILCVAILLIGAAFRLSQYLANRSLWYDEAMLTLNIINRSFSELAQPLDYDQGAPLGFLLIEKVLTVLLGNTEYALRIFPLICGLASIWAMYILAKRLFVEHVAVIAAVVLFACTDRLIYYASEVKQYSSDVLICLLLLQVTAHNLDQNPSNQRFVLLAVLGTAGLWISHPALFILAGAVATLGIHFIAGRDWRSLIKLGYVAAIWCVSVFGLYFISLRELSANRFMLRFWSFAFMPLPPWRDWGWFIARLHSVIGEFLGLPTKIIVPLLIVGVISISARRWQYGLMLLLPILLTLIASALRKYPFHGRLLLFLVPNILLIIAESIGRMNSAFNRLKRLTWMGLPVALGILAWVAVIPAYGATRHLWRPRLVGEIKPILSYLSHQGRRNDLLYVYWSAVPAFEYYLPVYRLYHFRIIWATTADKQKALSELHQLRGRGRVWFLLSDFDESFFPEHLQEIGRPLDQISAERAWLGLYDF